MNNKTKDELYKKYKNMNTITFFEPAVWKEVD